MLVTFVLASVATVFALVTLAGLGLASFASARSENEKKIRTVGEFHQALVAYANSNGSDQKAFQQLTMSSTSVEAALDWDNYVTGIRVGIYMLNNAALLPLAIQEMRREYSDGYAFRNNAEEIADAVQTVLFRHIGRRNDGNIVLKAAEGSFWRCVGRGWSLAASFPISVLSAFGLLNARRAEAARESVLFRLWNLVLGLAAILGPIIAYVADHEKVDAAIRAALPW